jgi:hypothetical protein
MENLTSDPRYTEILYWYDQPLIFTAIIEDELRLLIIEDEYPDHTTYLAASPTPEQMEQLKTDKLPVFDAFQQGPFYRVIYYFNQDNDITVTELDHLDPKSLSNPGVMLHY